MNTNRNSVYTVVYYLTIIIIISYVYYWVETHLGPYLSHRDTHLTDN